MSPDGPMPKIVQLDVGGTQYKVSRDTLERCEGSMLAILISDTWKEGNSEDEPIFIDRNGRLFEYVLDYLRTNKVYLPPSVSRAAMEEEFEYYGIDADMTRVNEKYGSKYNHALAVKIQTKQRELELLNAEKLAIQASHLIEYDFLKSNIPCSTVSVHLSYAEFGSLLSHQNLLRECLLAKGLDCVSSKRGGDYVPRVNGPGFGMTMVFTPNDSLFFDVIRSSA